jgi:hypothetical protein
MPWRGPSYPGEFPTLGYDIGDWIEAHCVIPDGDHVGEPFVLTDEQLRFLLFHYRIDPATGKFFYRRSQLVRPQKWGKGPLTAAIICAEVEGDVVPDGWNARGEPVGRPWATPWVQVTAVSQDQTDNVWRCLQPMVELGPLAELIPDTGETRINLRNGGRIEPVTASARSRLGQRITLSIQDETHSWVETNGGLRLADNQRRNLAGMGGRAVETTNAWDPAELSVAQTTAESPRTDIYRDHILGPPASLQNKAERRKALKVVYGDSWWVDLARIDAEAEELADRDPVQAERFFFNRVVATADSWLDGELWDARHKPREIVRGDPNRLITGERIVLGFDGSQYDDWTCIRAETLDGYQFTPTYGRDNRIAMWNPADHGGEIPRGEVNTAMHDLMTHYDVVRVYVDPPYWQSELDAWAAEFGDKKVLGWETRRDAQMSACLERLATDIVSGDLDHDGCPITAVHVRNAKKDRRRENVVCIKKDRPGSPRKIDAAVTSALAHEAAGDCIAEGLARRKAYGMFTA